MICPDIPGYSVTVDGELWGYDITSKGSLSDVSWAVQTCNSLPSCHSFEWKPQSGTGASTGAAWIKSKSTPVTIVHYTGGNCLYAKLDSGPLPNTISEDSFPPPEDSSPPPESPPPDDSPPPESPPLDDSPPPESPPKKIK